MVVLLSERQVFPTNVSHRTPNLTNTMKALATLALIALTLSSCTSDGRCIFAGKKKDCCSASSSACCAKKADDCKTCKH